MMMTTRTAQNWSHEPDSLTREHTENRAKKEEAIIRVLKIHFPDLIKALGGLEAVFQLPEIPCDYSLGYDHIDYIAPKELSARIMRGISITYRRFIALHLVCYKDGKRYDMHQEIPPVPCVTGVCVKRN